MDARERDIERDLERSGEISKPKGLESCELTVEALLQDRASTLSDRRSFGVDIILSESALILLDEGLAAALLKQRLAILNDGETTNIFPSLARLCRPTII
jgi:hypothetical protein